MIVALLAFCTVGVASLQAQDTLCITLDQAIQIAIADNPTIKVANQEIEIKKVASKEAYEGLLPEASLVGSYSRAIERQTMVLMDQSMKIGTANTYNGGISISLPVFAPALYRSISLTKSDVELAVEKSRASKLDMINQVTKAFYQLLLAQDSYAVLQKSYAQSEENYRIVNAKFEQGTVSEYDKISAEVQMRSLKPSVVSARNGVNLANLQLKVLMGMSNSTNLTIAGSLKDYEMAMFTRQARPRPDQLDNNSTLKQLDLNTEMLEKTLKLQKANFLPTLSASFQYVYLSLNDNFKFGQYNWNPYSTLGINLTVPLYKASNFTKIKQTRLQMKQLEENKINTQRQLTMQATSYLDNMAASAEQVVSNKEAVFQATKGRDIAEKRYEVGKGTVLEMNSSEVALTQAELTYNQSIYDYLVAKADLDLVIGVEDTNE
ncbi:MAG: TolC family protein, partial [Phocaeicola sp.]